MSCVAIADGHLEGNQVMRHQSLVVILDDTCHDRQFDKSPRLENGVRTHPRNNDKFEGILSKPDIDMLLTMFDTGIPSLCFLD
jgi:hypothetical protein